MLHVCSAACLSPMAWAPCWCSNTVAAWSVELCEVFNDRKTKAYFLNGGLQSGRQCCEPPPPPVCDPTEGESCPWPWEERKRGGGCGPLFSNCVFMSPPTVSVPQRFTMESIVCLGERAWVFCFNHFLKSHVWHGGGLALPVVGGRPVVLCAHFPASLLASVLSALCVVLWML